MKQNGRMESKIKLEIRNVMVTILKKSHRCEEGGALTPSKDESRGEILCERQEQTWLYGW